MAAAIQPKQRHKARAYAVQALYQWHFSGGEMHEIIAQFMTTNDHVKADWSFFRALIEGVLKNVTTLDAAIVEHAERPATEMNPVELAIVRLGAFELMHRIDVPYKVVINEYVDLAKDYGSTEGHTFVNGVLDKLAKAYRKVELGLN